MPSDQGYNYTGGIDGPGTADVGYGFDRSYGGGGWEKSKVVVWRKRLRKGLVNRVRT